MKKNLLFILFSLLFSFASEAVKVDFSSQSSGIRYENFQNASLSHVNGNIDVRFVDIQAWQGIKFFVPTQKIVDQNFFIVKMKGNAEISATIYVQGKAVGSIGVGDFDVTYRVPSVDGEVVVSLLQSSLNRAQGQQGIKKITLSQVDFEGENLCIGNPLNLLKNESIEIEEHQGAVLSRNQGFRIDVNQTGAWQGLKWVFKNAEVIGTPKFILKAKGTSTFNKLQFYIVYQKQSGEGLVSHWQDVVNGEFNFVKAFDLPEAVSGPLKVVVYQGHHDRLGNIAFQAADVFLDNMSIQRPPQKFPYDTSESLSNRGAFYVSAFDDARHIGAGPLQFEGLNGARLYTDMGAGSVQTGEMDDAKALKVNAPRANQGAKLVIPASPGARKLRVQFVTKALNAIFDLDVRTADGALVSPEHLNKALRERQRDAHILRLSFLENTPVAFTIDQPLGKAVVLNFKPQNASPLGTLFLGNFALYETTGEKADPHLKTLGVLGENIVSKSALFRPFFQKNPQRLLSLLGALPAFQMPVKKYWSKHIISKDAQGNDVFSLYTQPYNAVLRSDDDVMRGANQKMIVGGTRITGQLDAQFNYELGWLQFLAKNSKEVLIPFFDASGASASAFKASAKKQGVASAFAKRVHHLGGLASADRFQSIFENLREEQPRVAKLLDWNTQFKTGGFDLSVVYDHFFLNAVREELFKVFEALIPSILPIAEGIEAYINQPTDLDVLANRNAATVLILNEVEQGQTTSELQQLMKAVIDLLKNNLPENIDAQKLKTTLRTLIYANPGDVTAAENLYALLMDVSKRLFQKDIRDAGFAQSICNTRGYENFKGFYETMMRGDEFVFDQIDALKPYVGDVGVLTDYTVTQSHMDDYTAKYGSKSLLSDAELREAERVEFASSPILDQLAPIISALENSGLSGYDINQYKNLWMVNALFVITLDRGQEIFKQGLKNNIEYADPLPQSVKNAIDQHIVAIFRAVSVRKTPLMQTIERIWGGVQSSVRMSNGAMNGLLYEAEHVVKRDLAKDHISGVITHLMFQTSRCGVPSDAAARKLFFDRFIASFKQFIFLIDKQRKAGVDAETLRAVIDETVKDWPNLAGTMGQCSPGVLANLEDGNMRLADPAALDPEYRLIRQLADIRRDLAAAMITDRGVMMPHSINSMFRSNVTSFQNKPFWKVIGIHKSNVNDHDEFRGYPDYLGDDAVNEFKKRYTASVIVTSLLPLLEDASYDGVLDAILAKYGLQSRAYENMEQRLIAVLLKMKILSVPGLNVDDATRTPPDSPEPVRRSGQASSSGGGSSTASSSSRASSSTHLQGLFVGTGEAVTERPAGIPADLSTFANRVVGTTQEKKVDDLHQYFMRYQNQMRENDPRLMRKYHDAMMQIARDFKADVDAARVNNPRIPVFNIDDVWRLQRDVWNVQSPLFLSTVVERPVFYGDVNYSVFKREYDDIRNTYRGMFMEDMRSFQEEFAHLWRQWYFWYVTNLEFLYNDRGEMDFGGSAFLREKTKAFKRGLNAHWYDETKQKIAAASHVLRMIYKGYDMRQGFEPLFVNRNVSIALAFQDEGRAVISNIDVLAGSGVRELSTLRDETTDDLKRRVILARDAKQGFEDERLRRFAGQPGNPTNHDRMKMAYEWRTYYKFR